MNLSPPNGDPLLVGRDAVHDFILRNRVALLAVRAAVAIAVMALLSVLVSPLTDRGAASAREEAVRAVQAANQRCAIETRVTLGQAPGTRDFARLQRICHPEEVEGRGFASVALVLIVMVAGGTCALLVLNCCGPRT